MPDPVRQYPEEKFVDAKPNRPCPICNHGDWCGFNSIIASCMRVEEGSFKTVIQKNGKPAYLHWLKPGTVNYTAADIETNTVETLPVEKRDQVYRAFLGLLNLSQGHKNDLLRRGLKEWEIRKNGYKSVSTDEKPWEICKKLKSMGIELSGIPGFYKANGPRGGTYWTFNGRPGYFIPVRDINGRIQALQRRIEKPEEGEKKYRIFSSSQKEGGCSSGTPAHVSIPTEVKDSRVWITEGPLKADIAAKHSGAVFIGIMSSGTWVPAIEVLDMIVAKEVVTAYDMDFKTNDMVSKPLELLHEELIKKGLKVNQSSWWEKKKGIDDALTSGVKIKVNRVIKGGEGA